MKTLLKFAAAVALCASTVVHAHEVFYSTSLSGPAEAPPNTSPGTGTVLVTFDLDLVTMRVQANFSGLMGSTTAAHIHCCTTSPMTGTVGVASQTPSFAGFPLGVTSGTMDTTFDMTQASSYNASFITNNGGTVSTALNALLAGLDGGKAYFNLHTSAFPGGEIRGFLQPVPVPAAVWLLAPAVAGLISARKRAA